MKYTVNRAGSDRLRRSRALASSITASTNSGGNVLVNTPIATRSGNRSRPALTIRVTPATRKIIDHQVFKEAPLGYALACWLRDYSEQVWHFTTHLDVDWSSNAAERGVKPAKRHQAISGYEQTDQTLNRCCLIQ